MIPQVCGIAEAYYKVIPEHIKHFCDGRADGSIKSAVKEFNKKLSNKRVKT